MSVLLPLPIVLPLVAAGVSLMLGRFRVAQRALSVLVTGGVLAAAAAILFQVERTGPVATQMGGWEAPLGITLVADLFGAIMLTISALMVVVVLVYALGQLDEERESLYFHPAYLAVSAGVSASFVTGDLFNLFVAFEVMLIASYVLITLGADRGQIRSGMTYVVINLVASVMFVTGVALVYATTGTVNMADLVGRLDQAPEAVRNALGLLFLVVMGVKAGIFPLFFWLPDSYPTAPAPITALFAGLLTKVGVYAIFRTQTLLFGADGPSALLLFIAGATMLVGVLGAIAQNDVKRILSFHIISQIGYMIFGLGLFTLAGLAAAILYIVHHIVVKTTLFLVGGILESTYGSAALSRLGGVARHAPVVGVMFLAAAFSLAGIPPFSGFVAKLALVQEGFALDRNVIVGVSLLVSLLTLFSMMKIWTGAFWGTPGPADLPSGGADGDAGGTLRSSRLMVTATGALVGVSLLIAVGAQPLYALSERAAGELLDPAGYVDAVMVTGSEVARR